MMISGRQCWVAPVIWPRSSMCSRSRRTSSAPGRSALLTTSTSATSSRPDLLACTASPMPGATITTVVSAVRVTSTSTWPTPTVSTTRGPKPHASNRRRAPGTARASPPAWPLVAIDRMKARPSATPSMRMRSPSIAPPLSGDDGSTASTAGCPPASAISFTRCPTRVDLPVPGAPVTPITGASPCAWGWTRPSRPWAPASPRSVRVSSRPSARRSPLRARSSRAAAGPAAVTRRTGGSRRRPRRPRLPDAAPR